LPIRHRTPITSIKKLHEEMLSTQVIFTGNRHKVEQRERREEPTIPVVKMLLRTMTMWLMKRRRRGERLGVSKKKSFGRTRRESERKKGSKKSKTRSKRREEYRSDSARSLRQLKGRR
jgi:hypothetical protein